MTNPIQRESGISNTQRRLSRGAIALCLIGLASAFPASATTVDALCDAADDPCVVDQTVVIDDMSVFDLAGRALQIASNGRLEVGGGSATFVAGAITIEDGGEIRARGSGSSGGGVVVLRGSSLVSAGTIDVSGSPPGQVTVVVTGDIELSGDVEARALARNESGGTIDFESTHFTASGTLNANGGTEDSLGGDIEITATGDIELAGLVTVVGPDGGTITLTAGAGITDGSITLTATSDLRADGAFQGGFGGSVDLDASGDGTGSGHVRMSGSISVTGATAGEEIGGGSGGCLSVNASGNVVADNANALLTVEGGGPDGDGGEFDIVSDSGAVVVATTLDVSTSGAEGGGGALAIDAAGNIVVLGQILGFGGDGGEVALVSNGGGVTVDEAVTIDTNGRDFGSGGAICIESASTPSDTPASVVVNGDLLADGGGSAGSGGSVEIIGRDSARVVGLVTANGGLGGGLGGAVAVTALGGTAFIEGNVQARGRGESGGSVTVDGDRIEVPGSISVAGAGANSSNTDVGLQSRGPVVIAGSILATGAPGAGGLVEIIALGDVAIAGTLSADGGADPGGLVTVEGCSVLVCGFNAEPQLCGGADGLLRTEGPGGTNRITGRTNALIFGTMRTDLAGRNEVIVRPPQSQNSTILGTVTPPVIVVEDSELSACPVCGNRTVEPPETCDDGNTEDGDGCSADCRLEGEILRGDINGDGLVNDEDPGFLVEEIFDGDGGSVADVSGGSFAGGPGADVNGDGLVSSADFATLLRILGTS